MNRATWKIVEYICFVPLKYGQNKLVSHRSDFFDSQMEIHRIKLPMHPFEQCKKSRGMPECEAFNLLKPPCLPVHPSVFS